VLLDVCRASAWCTHRAQLYEQLDKSILAELRDGRHLFGTLRSYDQFGNLFLEGCVDRVVAGGLYADVDVGFLVVRGENVTLLAEVDDTRPLPLRKVPFDEIRPLVEQQGGCGGQ
jgi:U6 snRNA-associated Sm-like protein LSm1